jgi:KAP family P-loop domain
MKKITERPMDLRAHDEIKNKDKVNWNDYSVDRKETADFLLRIFKNSKGPLSIRLDAAYGSGKTTFLKCLSEEAHNDKFIVIDYNAWEEEITLDARSSLCLNLLQELRLNDVNGRVAPKISTLQKVLIPVVGKFVIASTSRAMFGNSEAIGDILNAVKLENDIEKWLRDATDNVDKNRSSISAVQSALKSIQNEFNKPILILVDELDRCRPDFAIEVLETIKHFFSIEGIFTLIGVDENVLHSIIKKRYGNQIDCEGYLLRHFNYKINFSKYSYEKYIKYGLKDRDIDDNISISLLNYIVPLCELYIPTMRQINTILNNVQLIYSIRPKNIHFNLLVFAYLLKYLDYDFYQLLLLKENNDIIIVAVSRI